MPTHLSFVTLVVLVRMLLGTFAPSVTLMVNESLGPFTRSRKSVLTSRSLHSTVLPVIFLLSLVVNRPRSRQRAATMLQVFRFMRCASIVSVTVLFTAGLALDLNLLTSRRSFGFVRSTTPPTPSRRLSQAETLLVTSRRLFTLVRTLLNMLGWSPLLVAMGSLYRSTHRSRFMAPRYIDPLFVPGFDTTSTCCLLASLTLSGITPSFRCSRSSLSSGRSVRA